MAERPGDLWFYALLREVAGVRSHRHALWPYLKIRAREALARLEQVPGPGWRV